MIQMMGRPSAVKMDSLVESSSMEPNRKMTRMKYHMSRLSFSLRDSLMVLVSVVMRDTMSPEQETVSVSACIKGQQQFYDKRHQCSALTEYVCSFTCGSFIKEPNLLLQHRLEDESLDGRVYSAHGDVVDEITHKLTHSAAETKQVEILRCAFIFNAFEKLFTVTV